LKKAGGGGEEGRGGEGERREKGEEGKGRDGSKSLHQYFHFRKNIPSS